MQISIKELSALVNGEIVGNPDGIIKAPGRIEDASQGEITFLANLKYEKYIYDTQATAVLVSKDFLPKKEVKTTLIKVENVYATITFLLNHFGGKVEGSNEHSKHSFIDESADLGNNVSIGHFSVIEKDSSVDENTIIFPQVYIGENVKIGKNCILYSGVKVGKDCVIGDNCIIHPNTVIGADGFGFLPKEDGSYEKIAQTGNVILEDNVEIGANSTIDRATMGSTIIKQGTKIDNLVMIAHNVEIGEHTVIAAQAGFAGSSKIGNNCMIGGQAGFVGHIQVANGTKVQAQSGVNKNIPNENTAWYGSPILPYNDYLRSYAAFRKLPQLLKKINDLEKKLKDLE